jgi:hypothetical protein
MVALPLPRSKRLANHMERVAATNGRSHIWQLHRVAFREPSRRKEPPRADGGGARPRVFLGMPFYGAGNIGDDLALAGFLEAWEQLGSPAHLVASIPFPLATQGRRFPAIEWLADGPHARDADPRTTRRQRSRRHIASRRT